MPRMDGVAMVQEMRKLRSADDLAVIALSETAEAGVLARFLKSGANDFLRKPFCVEELYCRIDKNIDMLRAVLDARRLANTASSRRHASRISDDGLPISVWSSTVSRYPSPPASVRPRR